MSTGIQAGGESADSEIYRELARKVARYCPAWLRDHADDIAQTAWLRLSASMKENEKNRDPGTTLIARVAYCTTIDEIRRHRRRRETGAVSGQLEAVPSLESGPERDAGAQDIRESILACLEEMIENRSLGVVLHLQGHNAKEVAAIMEWPVKRAENLIYRGMADLRACLSRKGMKP